MTKNRPAPPEPTAKDRLPLAVAELAAGIDCLCKNISGLRGDIVSMKESQAALQEAIELLRHRMQDIVAQNDRMELWLGMKVGYPRTQSDIPGYQQVRARIIADAMDGVG